MAGTTPIESAACNVMVHDLERAVRFYTRALGMHLEASHSGPAADWAELTGHGVRMVLLGSDRPTVRDAELHPVHVSIGFDVAELDGAMLVLRERGVEFAPEVAEDPEFRIAYFTDPDGTPLFLRERKRQGARAAGVPIVAGP